MLYGLVMDDPPHEDTGLRFACSAKELRRMISTATRHFLRSGQMLSPRQFVLGGSPKTSYRTLAAEDRFRKMVRLHAQGYDTQIQEHHHRLLVTQENRELRKVILKGIREGERAAVAIERGAALHARIERAITRKTALAAVSTRVVTRAPRSKTAQQCFAAISLRVAMRGAGLMPPTSAGTPTPDEIRCAREKTRMTKAHAARSVEVSPAAWHHWESGRNRMPREKWADFTGEST